MATALETVAMGLRTVPSRPMVAAAGEFGVFAGPRSRRRSGRARRGGARWACVDLTAVKARPLLCIGQQLISGVDLAKLLPDPVLTGIEVGQAVVAVLAVLMISGEYSSGMIRTTFIAMPRRWTVLAAKAVTLTGLVLAAAVVAVAGSLAAGRLILAGNGITAAHGFAVVSLAHGPTVRAAVGSVLYLALAGLLSLGIATIVRDSAAATGAVLGILYVPPVIALFLGSEPAWQHWVERYTPTNAGLAILNTTGLRDLPISPWAGLGVLAAWAAAALLAAGVLLHLRDA